ncbi:hypothetical protein BGZ54_003976, partial [Gamsiella multidivaricata]
MSTNIGYSLDDQQKQFYVFEEGRYFPKLDSANPNAQVLLRDGGDLFMEHDSKYHPVKLEDFDTNSFGRVQGEGAPIEQSKYRDQQQQLYHGGTTGSDRPVASVLQSLPLHQQQQQQQQHQLTTTKVSSLSMLKSPIDSYLTPVGSALPDSFSKPLVSAGRGRDGSNSRTSSQETEGTPSSAMLNLSIAPSGQSEGPFQIAATMQQHQKAKSQSILSPQQQQFQQQPPLLSTNASTPSPSSSSSTLGTTSSGSTDTISELPEDVVIRRAEQNRAAQRAFRQRKQKYIKWLESKAEELDEVYRIMALVRAENQQLCNLVVELDEKLNGSKSMAAAGTHENSNGPLQDTISVGGAVTTPLTRLPDSAVMALTGENLGAHGPKSRGIHGTDVALSKEISMRLMNLATFPGLNGERDTAMMNKIKYHPRSSIYSKGSSVKGKMAFKMSQQTKQQGALLQAALQPGKLTQEHQQQPNQQQQQQQQSLIELNGQ